MPEKILSSGSIELPNGKNLDIGRVSALGFNACFQHSRIIKVFVMVSGFRHAVLPRIRHSHSFQVCVQPPETQSTYISIKKTAEGDRNSSFNIFRSV